MFWLRIAVAAALAGEGAELSGRDQHLGCAFLCVAAFLMAAGFITSAVALLTAATVIVRMILDTAEENWTSFLVASILIAITVLGPGAYSIDHWLFGRKRITIGRPLR
ncbi:putative membrane protein YphA (DoxX/SURF4 family) [Silvibacterium bohemicum]|uniref:Putative membrane protein YphA (DoxX/SURF4 family) n=1 Tax=Silvibacterium bohemicum TaxID=1577686 RepID=A0A841JVB7_9BACT|nr:putative membrane protein YphA (DoxX/SURF4 family) [Silvibacterium bohemicum]